MKFLLLIFVLQVTASGAVSLSRHTSVEENDKVFALVSMNMIVYLSSLIFV